MLEEPKPVIVAALFPEIHRELVSLLKGLSFEDWQKPTSCEDWSVKDVALHLLGGDIGNLSRRRDGHAANVSIHSWDDLVGFVNEWNRSWVSVADRISPRLLIDLIDFSGLQMSDYFQTVDPFILGEPVNWAGPEPAPQWLDVAREYTERWHHQQHIRDAVGKPGLKQPKYFSPVLEAFIRAFPEVYCETNAIEDTSVTLTITGKSGGMWSILFQKTKWKLYVGAPVAPDSEIIMDEETAWRLFTRGISKAEAEGQTVINGNQAVGRKVFEMVSIIA